MKYGQNMVKDMVKDMEIWSKYGVCCTSFQSFEKFGTCWGKRESSKNWIFIAFLTQTNTISLREYQLILCMFGFLH